MRVGRRQKNVTTKDTKDTKEKLNSLGLGPSPREYFLVFVARIIRGTARGASTVEIALIVGARRAVPLSTYPFKKLSAFSSFM